MKKGYFWIIKYMVKIQQLILPIMLLLKLLLPIIAVNNLSKFYIFYCKNLNLKIPLNPFQLGDLFNVRTSTLKSLKPFPVYQFICLNCKACYIKETIFHLTKRIKEHFETDKTSC